jgi:protein tyrosine/serine phosphatase
MRVIIGSRRKSGYLMDLYCRLPFDPPYIDPFSRFFDALATTTGPLLVHCGGGKDRTGMIVALTHRLLDVHPDDIITDYLLGYSFSVDLCPPKRRKSTARR